MGNCLSQSSPWHNQLLSLPQYKLDQTVDRSKVNLVVFELRSHEPELVSCPVASVTSVHMISCCHTSTSLPGAGLSSVNHQLFTQLSLIHMGYFDYLVYCSVYREGANKPPGLTLAFDF